MFLPQPGWQRVAVAAILVLPLLQPRDIVDATSGSAWFIRGSTKLVGLR
jgi:hypothetical protein